MSLLSQIKAANRTALKSVETVDKSGLIKAGLAEEDIEAYHRDVFDTYVEVWEPLLQAKNLTFRTRYVMISQPMCNWLIEGYEGFEKITEKHDGDEKSPSEFDVWFDTKVKEEIGQELLASLQSEMDKSMAEFGCSKVFVKGQSRSAKDSVVFTNQLKSDLQQRIASLNAAGTLDLNTAVTAMLGAGKDSMASASALYFLRLFIRSERIYQDLTLAKEQQQEQQGFAIREWVDIDIGMEFRAFVYQGKLNAMCQYDYLVQIEDLLDETKGPAIGETMRTFWQDQVSPALESKFQHYVVDVTIDVNGKAWVIELNPFQESTDGAMFSWAREGDLLRGAGGAVYEFRVQRQKQNAMVCLSREWRTLLQEQLTTFNL